jgi:hypothetical protein
MASRSRAARRAGPRHGSGDRGCRLRPDGGGSVEGWAAGDRAARRSAALRARRQATLLPSPLDEVAAADAVRAAVVVGEGVGEVPWGHHLRIRLRDTWLATLDDRCPDRRLGRLRDRRCLGLPRRRLPRLHDMHGRLLRGFGRNRPDVLPRERRSRPRAESLGPRLGAHIPRCRARTTLGWPRPAPPPDVNDFNHSAFGAPEPAPPRGAEYEALVTGCGLRPLLALVGELLAGEYAICVGHAFPCLWAVASLRHPQVFGTRRPRRLRH